MKVVWVAGSRMGSNLWAITDMTVSTAPGDWGTRRYMRGYQRNPVHYFKTKAEAKIAADFHVLDLRRWDSRFEAWIKARRVP